MAESQTMMVPVFDKWQMIQGFLTLSEDFRGRREFVLKGRSLFRVTDFDPRAAPIVGPAIRNFHFHWAFVSVVRPPDELSTCNVLIVDDATDMYLCSGFRYLAEVYGTTKIVKAA